MLKTAFNVIKSQSARNFSRYASRIKIKKCTATAWKTQFYKQPIKVTIGFSFFSLFNFDKEHTVEDDIILNLKWSIVKMRRKEYDQAEQLLHITLRMAQQTQHQDAITYIYDVMANLALEQNQYKKAEKLFLSVMQRLLEKGVATDDIKNVHISVKLARIYHMSGNKEKAGIGFRWSIENLIKHIGKDETSDINVILATAKEWYGRLLIDNGFLNDGYKLLTESYEILRNFEKDNEEQIVILLNDMAFYSEKMNDLKTSEKFLKEAIRRGRKIDNLPELSVMHINLGRVFAKQGLLDNAKKLCNLALNQGMYTKNQEIIDEARSCLNELKAL